MKPDRPISGYRKSIRLRGYDYTLPGHYFVTIVTAGRVCLFGAVIDEQMVLSELGQIAATRWRAIPDHAHEIELDAFVVMPNHVHGVIAILAGDEPAAPRATRQRGPKVGSLGVIVGQFKSGVAREVNRRRGTPGVDVWQHNFYERIVRNDRELERIRDYIAANPARWPQDNENPNHRLR